MRVKFNLQQQCDNFVNNMELSFMHAHAYIYIYIIG